MIGLKIDVEGAEYPVFQQLVQEFPTVLPFGHLNVEIHVTTNHKLLCENPISTLF